MSSSFAARRKARIITQDDGDDDGPGQNPGITSDDRIGASARSTSKIRKKQSSRISFGPGGTSMTEEEDQATSIFTPKKSNLSRQAIEKTALRKSLGASLAPDPAPLRQSEDRPSYSTEYLNELKGSTPSTPKDLKPILAPDAENSKAIDLAAKFGSDLSVYENSAIPTDAEIREKKQRRARLAKEEEYINLHGSDESDDDSNEIALRPRKDHPETRLIHEDEDIAEGFDEYVDDGRIALGRKAEREQKRKHKSEMETLINEAEGGSSSDATDDSEVERRQAYEATQTRAGMDGLQKNENSNQPQRPRTPPRITPLPTLNGCLEKLQANLNKMQYEKMQRAKRLEEVRRDKVEMAEREVEIQRLLKEAGENYERLRGQIGGELAAATNGQVMLENGNTNTERGLESLGTPLTDVKMESP
ncbi:MAG: hypothetical protein Q9216_004761 [Gyalolechia sp. 2 TL-2023]